MNDRLFVEYYMRILMEFLVHFGFSTSTHTTHQFNIKRFNSSTLVTSINIAHVYTIWMEEINNGRRIIQEIQKILLVKINFLYLFCSSNEDIL